MASSSNAGGVSSDSVASTSIGSAGCQAGSAGDASSTLEMQVDPSWMSDGHIASNEVTIQEFLNTLQELPLRQRMARLMKTELDEENKMGSDKVDGILLAPE